jgi:hypothetical protein
MHIYEVHVEVDAASAKRFESYMREKHLPEILATQCFTKIVFEQESDTHFRTRYHAGTQADLDRYLTDHTAAFRADFQEHFPTEVRVWREMWKEVEVFTLP